MTKRLFIYVLMMLIMEAHFRYISQKKRKITHENTTSQDEVIITNFKNIHGVYVSYSSRSYAGGDDPHFISR